MIVYRVSGEARAGVGMAVGETGDADYAPGNLLSTLLQLFTTQRYLWHCGHVVSRRDHSNIHHRSS